MLTHLYECIEQNIAPVIYFEQGHSWLFEPAEAVGEKIVSHMNRQFEFAGYIYTVSGFAKNTIKEKFGKEAVVIPNAVDKTLFYANKEKNSHNDRTVITIIGSDRIAFKCIGTILEAVKRLKEKGYGLQLHWITPEVPCKKHIGIPAIINPEQKVIAGCLRESDIYICASLYESFCLPVLEAMTCGACVISTDNGGVGDFLVDHENGLLIEKNNVDDIVEKVEALINDVELREMLVKKALETSAKFDWDLTMDRIVEYYKEIAQYSSDNA